MVASPGNFSQKVLLFSTTSRKFKTETQAPEHAVEDLLSHHCMVFREGLESLANTAPGVTAMGIHVVS